MSLTIVPWLCAVIGAIMSITLMLAEYRGLETPKRWPLKVHMWGRFVLMHFVGVVWLIFTNM